MSILQASNVIFCIYFRSVKLSCPSSILRRRRPFRENSAIVHRPRHADSANLEPGTRSLGGLQSGGTRSLGRLQSGSGTRRGRSAIRDGNTQGGGLHQETGTSRGWSASGNGNEGCGTANNRTNLILELRKRKQRFYQLSDTRTLGLERQH